MAVSFINWLTLWPHLNRLDNFFSYYTLTAYYQAGMPSPPLPVIPWLSPLKTKLSSFSHLCHLLCPLCSRGQISSLLYHCLDALIPTQGREFPKLVGAWTTPEGSHCETGWEGGESPRELRSLARVNSMRTAFTQSSEQHRFSGKTLLPLQHCLIDLQSETVSVTLETWLCL